MTRKFSDDEVVTQGDEYLRAKAGQLDDDGGKAPDGKAEDAVPPAADHAEKTVNISPARLLLDRV